MALGVLALVATAGAVMWVTSGGSDGRPSSAVITHEDDEPTEAEDGRTEPEAEADADPKPDSKVAEPKPPGPAPQGNGLPAGATEVERPESYPYAASRVDCTAHTRVTDELKKLALDVDRQIRQGAQLSWDEEKALGDDAIAGFEKALGGKLVSTGAFPTYIEKVARPLLAHVARKEVTYRFYLWEGTDVVNALALPGGHIVVSRPLYDRWLENEAQLATVVGHEIGHVDLRHPVAVAELLRAMKVPEQDMVSQMLAQLVRIPYSTTVEERADQFSAEAAHAAGYSVFQAVKLWEARAKERGTSRPPAPRPDDPLGQLADLALGELENLTTTHPDPERRACLLRQAANDLFTKNPRQAVYVGWTNLSRRVPFAEKVF